MRKRILVSGAFLIVAGLTWASNEPWKGKPYQQWDKADLEIVLNNSPWAKKVIVDVNWKRDVASGGQSETPSTDRGIELRQHIETSKGGAPDSTPADANVGSVGTSGGTPTSTATTPKTAFYMRWYSSRVIREALAREAVINGRLSEAEGDKLLAEPVAGYEIILFGPDMTPFQSLTEDQLKSASYLEGKQSKQKVAPDSVRANKNPDGRTNSLVFSFPKKAGSGADVASAQEKGLEFVCRFKGLDLRSTFDTRKMVDKEGADF